MAYTKKGTLSAKRKFWRNHLNNWRESGLSLKEYCRRHDLSYRRSLYWKKKYPTRLPSVANVVEIKVDHPPAPVRDTFRSSLSLVFRAGYRLEIEPGFDRGTLKEIIKTLEVM